ncbi:MAG: 23S rRNA (guanosine(2251)-2'-O)-methyltransferase RlmB [Bacilli bacterium]|jgi:23S rRNA (guanosine2251-2'-O)-methyltransferase|nr:23S rRNA (guanosine(2251)-2'-O)-methyltransferase RlmB [Bacilli bacterium]MDD2681703.1 23S rRNA (guanosine(2251)-2'-O)-methyltransferase RlmB [Bacilli bacterium]MDD3121546.1 23S rRNA (guanosine(2251)-2'-O)-methyltransferase RlmB [Bacilli bacterium]
MSEIIYGKNVCLEAISSGRKIITLYTVGNNLEFIELAKKHNLNCKIVDKKFLDKMVNGFHQNICLEVEEYQYYDLKDVVKNINNDLGFLLILDGIEDPHNFGAILRTCEAAQIDGVIIPKNRSVQINNTVAKVSTGAVEYVKVIKVANIVQTIKYLKENGYWIVGAEASEKSINYTDIKYDMKVVLVIGSEGKGISRLVKESCDFLVKIPMKGHITSLNASVSTGVLIYEIIKYR